MNNESVLSISGRRRRRRRPVAPPRHLACFLIVAITMIHLCSIGLASSHQRWFEYNIPLYRGRGSGRGSDNVSRFSRVMSPSRFCENCLRIQRGGANRFVNDDNENQNERNNNNNSKKKNNDNNNNNDVETVGNGAFDERNGMQLDENTNKIASSKGLHSPVVYQYFGSSRKSRGGQSYQSSQADDAPRNFILLGPNVDHWKTVGQSLASRGFNVMACERMVENQQRKNNGDNDGGGGNDETYEGATNSNYEDAPDLVLEILDALKWDKAVLVGCDDDSSLAMETAMMLGPDRVAGLILCGDLTAANQFAEETGGVRVLDSFLHRVLDCPFVIVWDGGARSIVSGSSAHQAVESRSSPFDGDGAQDGRCVILGGGSAPHRTKPEYFAWVLRRFVDLKLEHQSTEFVGGKRRSTMSQSSMEENSNDHLKARQQQRQNRGGILDNLNLPFGIDSLVSPEGRLLLGRAVAAAIFYTSVMRVVFVQYGILRMGVISVKNSVDSVDALRRKIFQATGAFILNFGYIPRLFKFSLKRTKELDEDAIGRSSATSNSNIAADSPDEKENDEDTSDLPPIATNLEEDGTDDAQKEEEDDEDNEDTFRSKPLFFLDNIFT